MEKRTSTKMKLTDKSVAAAKPAARGAMLYWDTERRGFGLSVTPGAKSYIVQRRVHGKPIRYAFGHAKELSVAEACAEAEQHLARMAQGWNPVEERRQKRREALNPKHEFTLGAALDLYIDTLETDKSSERTIKDARYWVEEYLKDWLDRPLESISRDDAHRMHKQVTADVARGKRAKASKYTSGRSPGKNSGEATANAVFRIFRAVWNRAMKAHPELPVSPTINVNWHPNKRRKTAIATTRLHKWYTAVNALDNTVRRDYLLLTLLTGLRRNSAAEIRWQHLDLENRVLHIPKPKGGENRAFDLPLSGFLVDLLQARLEQSNGEDWVFPGVGKSGHIVDASAEEFGFTLHDLRRTFVTTAESLDTSPYAIKLLVNHALPDSDVTAGYVAAELERLRHPMQQITDRILKLCQGTKADVIQMPKKSRHAVVR